MKGIIKKIIALLRSDKPETDDKTVTLEDLNEASRKLAIALKNLEDAGNFYKEKEGKE